MALTHNWITASNPTHCLRFLVRVLELGKKPNVRAEGGGDGITAPLRAAAEPVLPQPERETRGICPQNQTRAGQHGAMP